MESNEEARRVRVVTMNRVATDIACFELEAADGRPLLSFSPGSHIAVQAPNGLVRQYSLCAPGRESRGAYRIAVKKETSGRGGSLSMHGDIGVGSTLGISGPRNHFRLATGARRHLFVAGGIGITPIHAMVHELSHRAEAWTLHYCARSAAHAAFLEELAALPGGQLVTHFSESPVLDLKKLLQEPSQGEHVYCCGPQALMAAVEAAAVHREQGSVHFEWFAAPAAEHPPNEAFEVELARSGLVCQVPADRSIVQALREIGVYVPCSCEQGICGTCETAVLAGEPIHRDSLLSEQEAASNRTMMVCVSRARSSRIVLDL